jgi:hypothetical protein
MIRKWINRALRRHKMAKFEFAIKHFGEIIIDEKGVTKGY